MKQGFFDLESRVINRGLCTSCGTCAGVCPRKALAMVDCDGEPVPKLTGDCSPCGLCFAICPGEDIPIPELEKKLFGQNRQEGRKDVGFYRYIGQGFSTNEAMHKEGSGGGIGTALLVHALEKGIIDVAIVAGFDVERPYATRGKIARTVDEIRESTQSKYAVVPLNQLLQQAVDQGFSRIGMIGLPCHIHAIRKLQDLGRPSKLARAVKLLVGLFCASEFYFEGTRHLITEWCQVQDFSEIKKLEYRGHGWPGHFVVTLKGGRQIIIDRHDYVYHMLIPNYRRDRCEMCIDWAAELSDVSLGDYWDPSKEPGSFQGSSLMMVRSQTGDELVQNALAARAITFSEIGIDTVIQNGGFELKKHGAAFRLKQRMRFGWPTPNFHYTVDHTPFNKGRLHLAPNTKVEKER